MIETCKVSGRPWASFSEHFELDFRLIWIDFYWFSEQAAPGLHFRNTLSLIFDQFELIFISYLNVFEVDFQIRNQVYDWNLQSFRNHLKALACFGLLFG